jgi:hypothetical protein
MEGYDDTETWKGVPIERLLAELQRKTGKLADAGDRKTVNVFNRAVIIGALAMMVAEWAAERLGERGPTGAATDQPPP